MVSMDSQIPTEQELSKILAPGVLRHPIIDGHLLAYQERDLDRFSAFYSNEIRGFKNGKKIIEGIAELRTVYGQIFATSPNLRVHIAARRIDGDQVFDTERVEGLRGSNVEIVAEVRYRIVDGQIAEMHLKI